MTQDDLGAIFDRLDAGDAVEGWGMSRHSDFDTLFNHERRQWQRDRVSDKWLELKVLGANLP